MSNLYNDGRKKALSHKPVGSSPSSEVRKIDPQKTKGLKKKKTWKSLALKIGLYVLTGIIGLLAGGYSYISFNILGAVGYTPVDIVSPGDADVNTPNVKPGEFDDINVDDTVFQGNTSSSWAEGGHTAVYVDERFPIKEVKQRDPNVQNILIFGVDARSTSEVKDSRADALMIVSLDKNTDSIKLISLMRDTDVVMEGRSSPDKINHAYKFGGVGLLINTVNENFDLDIQKFVMLDFSSASGLIDLVGGIPIEVSPAEVKYANESINEQNIYLQRYSPFLTNSGLQVLDGIQATAWSRIRMLDSDFVRTERQRLLADRLIRTVAVQDTLTQLSVLERGAGMIETNLTQNELLQIGTTGIQLVGNIHQYRIPDDGLFVTQRDPWKIIVDWDQQIPSLHEYIWGRSYH